LKFAPHTASESNLDIMAPKNESFGLSLFVCVYHCFQLRPVPEAGGCCNITPD